MFPYGSVPPDVRERIKLLRVDEYVRLMDLKSTLDPKEVEAAKAFFASDEGARYLTVLERGGLCRFARQIRSDRYAKLLKEVVREAENQGR